MLNDSFNLAAYSQDFLHRVQSAIVHSALAVSSEVVSEVQTVSFTGSVTGGTFTLSYAGQTTPAQPFNVSAAALQVALQALSTIGSGNAVVTGGPGPTAFLVTFAGTLASSPHSLFTFSAASLTGTTPGMAVARTTSGVGLANHAARQILASKVLADPASYARLIAIGVADNAKVLADYPATDGYLPSTGIITNATNANPIVITSLLHGLTSGDIVVISGVLGNLAANGTRTITVLTADTFSIGVAGGGVYTSGGLWLLADTTIDNDIQFQVNSIFNAYC